MYTRGQFALIGKTTIKALRIYDEIGLLKPKRVEVSNQYKYYSAAQIDEIIFINELKVFGFSLEEIKKIKENNENSYIIEKFTQRLSKLETEVNEISRAKTELTRKIQAMKSGITLDGCASNYIISVVELGEMIVASSRERINIQDVGRLIGKVYENIYKFSLEAVDSHMIIYHDNELDLLLNDWDIEVCIPVNKSLQFENFSTKIIDGKSYVKATHIGGFSEVGKAHGAVIDWIKDNGYKICGCPMEKYTNTARQVFRPTGFEIEVYYPVKKVDNINTLHYQLEQGEM